MKTKIIFAYFALFTIPHELCHFVAGRLLGVRTEIIDARHVKTYDYDHTSRWKMIVIDLAPTLLGLLLALWVGLYVLEMPKQRIDAGLVGAWYVLTFLSTCIGDWRDAWYDRTGSRPQPVSDSEVS